MSKKFQRTVEDFVCEHCGREVCGDGYTNHCSYCLWSKHVDIYPGDRGAKCGGLMKPIRVEGGTGKEALVHECQKCGHRKINKLSPHDDFQEVLKIIVSIGQI